jgi:hypothetical protein
VQRAIMTANGISTVHALLIIALAGTPVWPVWAEFSRAPAPSQSIETVSIATDGAGDGETGYRFTLVRRQGAQSATFATSTRTCAAARVVVPSMPALAMPKLAPYGLANDGRKSVSDGVVYTLSAPTSFTNGMVTMTSNRDSPLADWIDGALRLLAPCWIKTS